MTRFIASLLLLLTVALPLTGCVVAPVGPGWRYHHPYRCR